MMHVMNPGVNESANKLFRGPSRSQSISQLSPWDQQQHQQQHQHQPALVGQPLSQPQGPFGQLPQQYELPVAGADPGTAGTNMMDPHKRMRGGRPTDTLPPQPLDSTDEQCEQQQHGKRSRGNAYRAPREVKATLTSVMGSLVGGTSQQTTGTIRMRRQLSGSQLDQFMSQGEDKMDEDAPAMRERAMSF
jgi:hypothetical protein